MPSVYPMDDISAGGSSKGGPDPEQKLVGTIEATQVIETANRRFISDDERALLYNIITKDTYDKDGDGLIDYATEAGHTANSDNANEANHALNADHATEADSASEALHATNADNTANATNAEHADTADNALNANNALHATAADRATNAEIATNANYATTAGSASSAENSNHANEADHATNADHSNNADRATVADSVSEANHALEADHALNADNAVNATNANHAITADSATTANTAESIDYSKIKNVPETFTPSSHSHIASQVHTDEYHRFVSEQQILLWNAKQDRLTFTPEDSANKGAANGYAPLNGDGKVPSEHLDDVLWGNIKSKPTSTVEAIDEAVQKSHQHINFSVLEAINANIDNKPTWYNGEWPYPGDMKKSQYDKDDDGIVDVAKSANSVTWNGIDGKPTSAVEDIDNAVSKSHAHSNTDALNLMGIDGNGNPIWNNDKWPYDMKSSDFDKDNDGVIDLAKKAQLVEWKDISDKPNSTVEEIDNSVGASHAHNNKSVLDDLVRNDLTDHVSYRNRDLAYTNDVRALIIQDASELKAKQSIEIDVDGKIHLTNDSGFIDPLSYYGTDNSGLLGWHSFDDIFNINKPKLGTLLTYNEDDEIEFINQNTFGTNKFFGADESGIAGFYTLTAPMIELDADHDFITSEEHDQLREIIEHGGSGETTINNYYTYNTIQYDTRQTILSAMPGFFSLDGSDLIIQANENNPLVMTFSCGSDEVVRKLKENVIISNLPSILRSGNAYIYAKASKEDDSILEFRKTSLEPIYSPNKPTSIEADQFWFNTKEYTMYISDGNKYNKCEDLILFIGYVISDNGSIMYGNYAINAMFDSGWYDVEYSTTYSKNHNIGSDIVTYNAFIGIDGINYGEFAFALQGTSLTDLHPVGDRVSLITKNTIQTTRYFNIPYSAQAFGAVYNQTTQHRVIVRRAW